MSRKRNCMADRVIALTDIERAPIVTTPVQIQSRLIAPVKRWQRFTLVTLSIVLIPIIRSTVRCIETCRVSSRWCRRLPSIVASNADQVTMFSRGSGGGPCKARTLSHGDSRPEEVILCFGLWSGCEP